MNQKSKTKNPTPQGVGSSEIVSLLAETIEREAADCEVSAAKNGTPYGEAFQTTSLVLRSLAKKLRAEIEKPANTDLSGGD